MADSSLAQRILDASTHVAVIATDMEGVITVFNTGAEQLLGHAASQVAGRETPLLFLDREELQLRARDLRHELGRDVNGLDVLVAPARDKGHEVREWTCVRKDGSRLAARLAVTAIKDAANMHAGYLFMAVDTSAEKAALHRADETGQRLRAVLHTAVDGIFTVDESGRILSANPAACGIFGYAMEELVGNPVTMLMPEPIRGQHDSFIKRYLDTGRAAIIGKPCREVQGLHKDGTLLPLELAVSDTRLGQGIVFTGMLRDISKRKDAEQALISAKQLLEERQARLELDLDAAGDIQRSLLPKVLPLPDRLEVSWRFEPSHSIGGDIFNILPLDRDNVAIYMLDVSGHGVDSALVAVSVSQQLRPENGLVEMPRSPGKPANINPPCQVVEYLDTVFPLKRFEKFMTLIYLVLDTRTGEYRYCNAGHPAQFVVKDQGGLEPLDQGGTVIGLDGLVPFSEGQGRLHAGDTLFFYTDGVLDYPGTNAENFGPERLARELERSKAMEPEQMLDELLRSIYRFGDFQESLDDITMLAVRFSPSNTGSDAP